MIEWVCQSKILSPFHNRTGYSEVMSGWQGKPAGNFKFGVVTVGSRTPEVTELRALEGKPVVIHFYSDG